MPDPEFGALKVTDAEYFRRITIIDTANGVNEEWAVETSELAAAIIKYGWTVYENGIEEPEATDSECEEDEDGELGVPVEYEYYKFIELCGELRETECSVLRAARLLAAERTSEVDAEWLKTLSEQQLEDARHLMTCLGDADTLTYTYRHGGTWHISTGLFAAITLAALKATN